MAATRGGDKSRKLCGYTEPSRATRAHGHVQVTAGAPAAHGRVAVESVDHELAPRVDRLDVPNPHGLRLRVVNRLVHALVRLHAPQEVVESLLRVRPLIVVVAELHAVVVGEDALVVAHRLEEDERDGRRRGRAPIDDGAPARLRGVGRVEDAAADAALLAVQPREQVVERLHRHLLLERLRLLVLRVEEARGGASLALVAPLVPRVEELA